MLNKQGQIGETITWIVATIIIIVTLVIFIYVSSVLVEIKKIKVPDLKIVSEEEVNWIEMKTSFAYLINEENKEIIDEWIMEREDEK